MLSTASPELNDTPITNSYCTVAVTVFSGKSFAQKHHSKLYVSCTFNNEILTTDPVEQTSNPVWNTEFSWALSPKTLSYLRSQRAHLKLICYSLQDTVREVVGYCMLDLRATQTSKYFSLICSKSASSFRPEIKILFKVTSARDHLNALSPIVTKASLLPPPQPKQTPRKPLHHGGKNAKLNADGGSSSNKSSLGLTNTNANQKFNKDYKLVENFELEIALHPQGWYQIGNPQSSDSFYTLWITIAFAENLVLLQKASSHHESESGYYFYYTLLGNDILTQRFKHLNEPNFPAERVSIRFKTQPSALEKLLGSLGNIVIHLCQELKVIGYAHCPISSLSVCQSNSMIEEVYQLFTPEGQRTISNDGKVPNIGISFVLALDSQATIQPLSPTRTKENLGASSTAISHEVSSYNQRSPSLKSNPLLSSPLLINSAERLASLDPPGSCRQYRVSIDLKSVSDCVLENVKVCFRYFYPQLGSVAPVISHPSHELVKSSAQNESKLTAFTAFEFVMNSSELLETLKNHPLIVSMISKSEMIRDELLGEASINMLRVFSVKSVSNSGGSLIHSIDIVCPVYAYNSDGDIDFSNKLLDLRVVLAVEDFGLIQNLGDSQHQDDIVATTEPVHNESEYHDADIDQEITEPPYVLSYLNQPEATQKPLNAGSNSSSRNRLAVSKSSMVSIHEAMNARDASNQNICSNTQMNNIDNNLSASMPKLSSHSILGSKQSIQEQPRITNSVPNLGIQSSMRELKTEQEYPKAIGGAANSSNSHLKSAVHLNTVDNTPVNYVKPATHASIVFKETTETTNTSVSKEARQTHNQSDRGSNNYKRKENLYSAENNNNIQQHEAFLASQKDLEVWRCEQETQFLESLREKEQLVLSKLISEWKSRESLREESLQLKLEECKKLEHHILIVSEKLEERETSLLKAEQMLEARKLKIEDELNHQVSEYQSKSKRMALDFEHSLKLEREKTLECQASLQKAKIEIETRDHEYKLLEKEFYAFRSQVNTGDPASLSSKLSEALVKNAELLSAVAKKDEEILELKSKMQKVAKAYKSLKTEIERGKIDKLERNEERLVLLQNKLDLAEKFSKTRIDLEACKTGLESLKENYPSLPEPRVLSKSEQQSLDRMKRERAELISSGTYTPSDGLIQEIDARIKSLQYE